MRGVDRVAGAGDVVHRGAVCEPVVRAVVDAAEAQRRPVEPALGGVVVDHVEDHFDAGGMERGDHRLELGHLLTARARGRVRRVGREEAEGVVTPVVRQAAGRDRGFGQEVVDRQQLDRRHPEVGQIADHGRVRETGVRPALVLGYVGMEFGEALGVQLVDDRLAPVHGLADRRWRLRGGDDHADRDMPGRVAVGRVVDEWAGEVQRAVDGPRVRVEQELGRVEAEPVRRVERTVHAVPVPLAGADTRDEPGPVFAGMGQIQVPLAAVVGDQRQLDALGCRSPERERRPIGLDHCSEPESGRGGGHVGHRHILHSLGWLIDNEGGCVHETVVANVCAQ